MTDAQAQAAAMKAMHKFKLALENGGDTADIEAEFYAAVGAISDDAARISLENALMDLNDADSARLAQEYAKIAAKFKSVQEGFDLGTVVAEDGKKGLFFPTAAAYLAQVEGIVTEIAAAAKEVRAGIDEIKAGVASADDAIEADNVDALIASGVKIKETVEGLVDTFTELKNDLSS